MFFTTPRPLFPPDCIFMPLDDAHRRPTATRIGATRTRPGPQLKTARVSQEGTTTRAPLHFSPTRKIVRARSPPIDPGKASRFMHTVRGVREGLALGSLRAFPGTNARTQSRPFSSAQHDDPLPDKHSIRHRFPSASLFNARRVL